MKQRGSSGPHGGPDLSAQNEEQAMLHATPLSIFSCRYAVRRDGEVVAQIDPAWFSEAAEVIVAGEPCTLTRESLLDGTFAMRRGDQVVARARKPSAFASVFEVELPGHHFQLKAVSCWGREFRLFESGFQVGRIAPARWWSGKASIDLPNDLPAHAQVFLFWLVLLLWWRSQAAAVGAVVAAGS
jgi:hypothetical protein